MTLTATGTTPAGRSRSGVHATVTCDRPAADGLRPIHISITRDEFGGFSAANALAIDGGSTAAAATARAFSTSPSLGAQ